MQSARACSVCSNLQIVYSMHNSRIDRANISEAVANRVRQMIVDGAIEPGSRVNEVHLARDLGVSRTPLREAIARLVREDTLVAVPRVGAFVKSLSVEEFDQVYSIRNLLDPEALRAAGLPSEQHLKRLERLNAKIESASDADTLIDLDDQWHLMLLEHCTNK